MFKSVCFFVGWLVVIFEFDFCRETHFFHHLFDLPVYTVCFIMIPPWMSEPDADGVRWTTFAGKLHTTMFITIAALACVSHFKAMTTDPGAVPPDAKPLPTAEEKAAADVEAGKPKKGLRLCRRCNSYKPQRAHHCR